MQSFLHAHIAYTTLRCFVPDGSISAGVRDTLTRLGAVGSAADAAGRIRRA